jgi:hypothetical protein
MAARATADQSMDEERLVTLSADEEAELEDALDEADDDERHGRLVPAALFLEQQRRPG